MKYKLINDTPVEKTSQGSHASLAKSIAQHLNDKNNQINSIAIYGEWGSGKSSVVKMLETELEANLITFDIWNHTGELLRRSFLNRLLQEFELQDKLYDPETLEPSNTGIKLKDIVSGKYQKIISKNEPKDEKNNTFLWAVSFLAAWAFEIAILQFSSRGLLGEILKLNNKEFKWWLWVDFVVWSILIRLILEKSTVLRQLFTSKTAPYTEHDITQTTTLQSQDIPEYLFERIYNNIVLEKISRGNKKYLICLDNIDRMGVEQASLIIDELNIFLHSARNKKNIYFVVPIDDNMLHEVITHHSNHKNDSVDTFIHKLFPISYRLPDMINHEWRDLLKEKLREAKITDDATVRKITWISDLCRRKPLEKAVQIVSKPPLEALPLEADKEKQIGSPDTFIKKSLTPREIIFFVNKLVTTYTEINGSEGGKNLEIDIITVARYAALTLCNGKQAYTNYFSSAYSDHCALVKQLCGEDPDTIEQLYCIHYQTNKPYETLYRDRLTSAIEVFDRGELSVIKDKIPGNMVEVFIHTTHSLSTENIEDFCKLIGSIKIIFTKEEDISHLFKDALLITTIKKNLKKEIYQKWDEDEETKKASPRQMLEVLVFCAQNAPTLKEEIKNFWQRELYNFDSESKSDGIIHNKESYKGRTFYLQFLSQTTGGDFIADNNDYISWFWTNFIAYDEPSIEEIKLLSKYFNKTLLSLVSHIRDWVKPENSSVISVTFIDTIKKCLTRLYPFLATLDNKTKVLDDSKELGKTIIKSLTEDFPNNNKPDVFTILIESSYFIAKQGNIKDLKTMLTAEFWSTPIPVTIPWNNTSYSNPAMQEYVIATLINANDGSQLRKLFYILCKLGNPGSTGFGLPITSNLINIISNIFTDEQIDIPEKVDIFQFCEQLFATQITALWGFMQSNLKKPSISALWGNLIESNIDIYKNRLPQEWHGNKEISEALVNNLPREQYIELATPFWEQNHRPLHETEWKYLIEYCNKIDKKKLFSFYSSNSSSAPEDSQKKIVLELLAAYENFSENKESAVYKNLSYQWLQLFSTPEFNSFFNKWKSLASDEQIVNECLDKIIKKELENSAFIQHPHLLENSRLMGLDLSSKKDVINSFIEYLKKEKDSHTVDTVVKVLQGFEIFSEKLRECQLL